jgi:predicted secreted protein
VRTFERSGLWGVLRGTPADADAIVYQLDIGDPERARSFLLTKDGELRQLDRRHNEIASPAPHSLHRQSAARDASIVTITADDAGQRVVVEVGQALVVKLDGNRSTGYRWTRSSSEGGVLLSLGGADAFHEPAGAERALGASRDESWWFAVASPGSQQLTFQYRRPWESDAPSARRVAYVIDATASRR